MTTQLESNVKKPNVYVVNNSGYPYEKAERFGEVIFMTAGSINHSRLNSIITKIGNYIENSSPNDYLCVSGNNFLCTLAGIMWGNKHGLVKILHWSQSKKDYETYNIMAREFKDD